MQNIFINCLSLWALCYGLGHKFYALTELKRNSEQVTMSVKRVIKYMIYREHMGYTEV